jgi:outer membrane receptor protein involved in Fe transport
MKQNEDRYILGYNSSYANVWSTSHLKIESKIGSQIRYDVVNNSELSNVRQRDIFIKAISLGDINQFNAAIYIDEQISINDKWSANIGTRYDVFNFDYKDNLNAPNASQIKSIVSPKASLFYKPSSKMQLFAKAGKGFHSNDSRVVTAQKGITILPAALGSEVGAIAKPTRNLLFNLAFWQLDLDQEFVYVGDEAVVEASGATRRLGVDFSTKFQISKMWSADIDFNFAYARSKFEPKEANHIPLAPIITSTGGLMYKSPRHIMASVRYRHLGNRPANEINTIVATGYTLIDAVTNSSYKRFNFGVSIENILNTSWKEAQFETETKLKNEKEPVSEIHFTAGTPFSLKFIVGYQL